MAFLLQIYSSEQFGQVFGNSFSPEAIGYE